MNKVLFKHGEFSRQKGQYVVLLANRRVEVKLGNATAYYDKYAHKCTDGYIGIYNLDDYTTQLSVLESLRKLIYDPINYEHYGYCFSSTPNANNMRIWAYMEGKDNVTHLFQNDELFTMGIDINTSLMDQRARMISRIGSYLEYNEKVIVLDLLDEAINYLKGG